MKRCKLWQGQLAPLAAVTGTLRGAQLALPACWGQAAVGASHTTVVKGMGYQSKKHDETAWRGQPAEVASSKDTGSVLWSTLNLKVMFSPFLHPQLTTTLFVITCPLWGNTNN